MRQHLADNSPAYEVEYKIQTKHGQWKWFHDRGIVTERDDDGAPLFLAGIVFDISEEVMMMQSIGEKNEELLRMVDTDYLTGVYNRRALFKKVKLAIKKSDELNENLSILMIDLDNFKSVNDTYGHSVGDDVLIEVARVIKNSVRRSDIVGRYGGEEFVVIFPRCTKEQCFNIAERIRQNIENLHVIDDLTVTISRGIVEYKKESVDTLFNDADKLMYDAKNKGKNRLIK